MAPGSRLQELTAKYMQNPRRFFVPLANEYRIAGDLDRAIALCREHLPAQPGHMSGHIVLGRAYFEKGDFAAARDVFMTSVSLDDENLIALRHLGDIARLRADAVEARGWYARVLDADPENREIEQLLRSLDSLAPAGAEAPQVVAPEAPVEADEEPIIVAEVPDLVQPEPTPSSSPAVQIGDLSSALADPTPPGLRAILGEDTAPAFDPALVRVPDAPPPPTTRPLETFDLASLGPAVEAEIGGFDALGATAEPAAPAPEPDAAPLAEQFGITVEGGGFAFHDLDELVDPAVAGTVPDSLPPIEEADFTTGVETPTATPAAPPTPAQDEELLSRPVFGALASFQSWRTAQERDTPSAVTPQTSVPTPVPTPEIAAADDDGELFWQGTTGDTAATAPEFVTETMAALYAQQGFTRQALDIYRTLLERNPSDAGLAQKVMQLQAALEVPAIDASLEEDADKALEFGDLQAGGSPADGAPSALEAMYEASPVADADPLSDAFGTAWTPAADADLTAGDDWFADAADADHTEAFTDAGSDMFGFALDGFTTSPVEMEPAGAKRPAVALAAVLGATAAAAADETAADMLAALAAQMVGRLPKEPPTLPVPDVLELPSAVAGDETTGASPAPLLSFDRFFSGSGSPPRPRVDTPARPSAVTPRDLPAAPSVPSPSLSPTFGGVPVIPPPSPNVTPTWAGFDKFVPPTPPVTTPRVTAPTPPSAPVTQPTPTGAFWTPAMVPAIPEQPVASTPRPVTPPATPVTPAAPTPAEPAAAQDETPQRRTPPSDFHAWLEGLS